ncbi:MAG: benzoate transporter BenE [Alphaproteobacteria bacterium]|nr:benzoate transporter BenE [Alphaproteobacteria bacterium]
MRGSISVPAATAGVLAAMVGFASSFAIILQGLTTVGASPAQAASGLMAVCVAMGAGGIFLSLRSRMPISVAWSTPGAALLAGAGSVEGGFAAAVGAFLVSGLLVMAAGFWKPLGRWVAAIPASLANAMLAGVLLGLCLAPVRAVAAMPMEALAIIAVWAVVARVRRLWAVPAAVLVTLALVVAAVPEPSNLGSFWPAPAPVVPAFSPAVLVGVALPLFIVTMASQNIPGLAVLNVNGYRPEAGPLLQTTGFLSVLAAPFGGHAVNLAAITAALCAGPDAHPDPARRYWAGAVAGAVYILFGLSAGVAAALFSASPPILIEAVAGLALLGAFAAALQGAMAQAADREAAAVTFLVTASGLSFLGIGGAFWGLLAGGTVRALMRWRQKPAADRAQ